MQPHKINFYLEKREPDFDKKMEDILIAHRKQKTSAQAQKQKLETPGKINGKHSIPIVYRNDYQRLSPA
jgi:hypothetical protein